MSQAFIKPALRNACKQVQIQHAVGRTFSSLAAASAARVTSTRARSLLRFDASHTEYWYSRSAPRRSYNSYAGLSATFNANANSAPSQEAGCSADKSSRRPQCSEHISQELPADDAREMNVAEEHWEIAVRKQFEEEHMRRRSELQRAEEFELVREVRDILKSKYLRKSKDQLDLRPVESTLAELQTQHKVLSSSKSHSAYKTVFSRAFLPTSCLQPERRACAPKV